MSLSHNLVAVVAGGGYRGPLYLGLCIWKAKPIPFLSQRYPSFIRKWYLFTAMLKRRIFQSPLDPTRFSNLRPSASRPIRSNHSINRKGLPVLFQAMLTHINNISITELQFSWKPPDTNEGDVIFKYVFLQNIFGKHLSFMKFLVCSTRILRTFFFK